MKLKKLTALAMTTAMCAGAIFGCGGNNENKPADNNGGEAKKVALKVWCPQEDQTSGWIQKECENFNKAHPEWDITFTYETCGEGDAGKNVTADPEAAGDVFFFANDQLMSLINADAISKLGGSTADYIKETNSEKLVSSVTVDGNIYGIPFTANTWFMYYDKSAFSEEDVKSLDTMLTKGVVAFPLTNTWYAGSFFAAAGATYSGPMGNDEAAGTELGDKAAKVTEYIIDLFKNENLLNKEGPDVINGLKDGSIDAMFSGSWDYQNVKGALGDNIGVVSLPTIKVDGTDYNLKSFAGSKCIGVNPHCDNQEVAVALAKHLASTDAQQSHFDMRTIPPCHKDLLATEAIKNNALVQAQNDTFENTSVIQPLDSKFNGNYWTAMGALMSEIQSGDCTKDNAAEKTQVFEDACNGK